MTNRGRNFALENRDRGEGENVGHSGLLLVVPEVAGDIFSAAAAAAAYLAIWPLSSDLQSDLNSHQQKIII